MKKVIYSLLLVFAAVFIACEEELPKANFDLYELKSLEATAGDMSVTLAWEDYENARPSEYLVVWDAGNAGSDGGQMTVEAGKKSVVVENLENDMTYSFSVQPRYANGLAGKTSVKSTPKNARYPVTDLSATAGSERVRLSWTKPNSERFTNYQITVNPGGKVITLDDTSLEFYVVDGLVNDTEYTFSMIASYPTGNSEVVEASATPGKLSPILIDQSDKTELILWESATFTLNDMFFMGGDVQSVSWDFGDGTISTELSPQHAYGTVKDKYTVSVTVTYTNGTADTGSMDVAVVNYKWNSIKLQSGNYTGYVKVSNPVFSPDGKTMYIPTSTPAGHLFAIDVATGDFKWVYGIDALTYGGGALVGDDGTVYQCDATNRVYAITPNGDTKWTVQLDGATGAFPALSKDGVLYCLTNKITLYALDTKDNGKILFQETLGTGGNGSAVAVDKDGNVYAGTSLGIFFFDASGGKRFEPLTGVNVTERGSFALNGNHLYATLKATGGLISVDMVTGKKEWTYNSGIGTDSYFPIVDKNGVVYFTDKGAKNKNAHVYAVNASGNLEWSKEIGTNQQLTYNGVTLGADGYLYVGHSGGKKVWKLDTNSNGALTEVQNVGQNVMAGVTIGPDRRLYFGTVVSNNIGSVKAVTVNTLSETSSWSMRGGDLQGTNRQK